MTTIRTMEGDELTVTLLSEYLSGSRGDLETAVDERGVSTLYSQDGAVSFTSSDRGSFLCQVYGDEGTVIATVSLGLVIHHTIEVTP